MTDEASTLANFTLKTMFRFAMTFSQTNIRIAQLTQKLQVSIASMEDMDRILAGHAGAASGVDGLHTTRGADQARLELRGLLVLRYRLMTKAINLFGLHATDRIMTMVKDRLVLVNIEPDDYGYSTLSIGPVAASPQQGQPSATCAPVGLE